MNVPWTWGGSERSRRHVHGQKRQQGPVTLRRNFSRPPVALTNLNGTLNLRHCKSFTRFYRRSNFVSLWNNMELWFYEMAAVKTKETAFFTRGHPSKHMNITFIIYIFLHWYNPDLQAGSVTSSDHDERQPPSSWTNTEKFLSMIKKIETLSGSSITLN